MSDPTVSKAGQVSPDLGSYSAQDVAAAKGKSAPGAGPKASSRSEKMSSQVSDLNLRFMINSDTKDVTILVVNRSNKQVVRTIPPEEASKLDPGELLQLFA